MVWCPSVCPSFFLTLMWHTQNVYSTWFTIGRMQCDQHTFVSSVRGPIQWTTRLLYLSTCCSTVDWCGHQFIIASRYIIRLYTGPHRWWPDITYTQHYTHNEQTHIQCIHSHSPTKTLSRSNQPFFHSSPTGQTDQQTDRETDRQTVTWLTTPISFSGQPG